jgi:hypothetical protein
MTPENVSKLIDLIPLIVMVGAIVCFAWIDRRK